MNLDSSSRNVYSQVLFTRHLSVNQTKSLRQDMLASYLLRNMSGWRGTLLCGGLTKWSSLDVWWNAPPTLREHHSTRVCQRKQHTYVQYMIFSSPLQMNCLQGLQVQRGRSDLHFRAFCPQITVYIIAFFPCWIALETVNWDRNNLERRRPNFWNSFLSISAFFSLAEKILV